MKTLLTFVAATLLLMTACTTQYQARTTYDDLYYSPKDAVAAGSTQQASAQPQTKTTDRKSTRLNSSH